MAEVPEAKNLAADFSATRFSMLWITFWWKAITTIIGLTAFAIWLIYNWWHDR